MRVINVRNVNNAVAEAIPYLLIHGDAEPSRNGDVIVAPEPVTTVYNKPTERVLFGETRDANPFFHLMESLWMLAGRNDLAFPMFFNKNFASYSDDGLYVHGAYGHRWRKALGFDQLEVIAKELIKNPASRRCVLQMWDGVPSGSDDLGMAMYGGKDVPCNTQVYFDVRYGVLNMTVTCRSNDIIWGAYGANVVHMSILQEYMAAWVGVPVGVYRQVSNNFHAYTDIYDREKLRTIAREAANNNFYLTDNPIVKPSPLVNTTVEDFDADLKAFFNSPTGNYEYRGVFFRDTVRPMYLAWDRRKKGMGSGMELAVGIGASDWRAACTSWIARREGANATA